MDNSKLLHIFQPAHQLNGESTDESLLEARIVVHLDELVEVEAEQVERHAQVVAEHEVVLDLNNALFVVVVIFLN